jgi:hypothetical protein
VVSWRVGMAVGVADEGEAGEEGEERLPTKCPS